MTEAVVPLTVNTSEHLTHKFHFSKLGVKT
jgi:hypothetical protein